MKRNRQSKLAVLLLAVLALGLPGRLAAQTPGPRLALVIGEGQYRGGVLPTALNDAGLLAQTLQGVGFEVTGAANLDAVALRRAFGDFLAKVQQAGPEAVVFVYLSGQGAQYAGENYLVPIEATIARDSAVPTEAVRVADFIGPLEAMPAKARIVVLDASHRNNFAQGGTPLAGGLALTDPNAGSLYAFNAAPGTVAPDEQGPYGVYARSLTEMLRQGGASIDEVFAQTRLRVNDRTRGALIPWDESKIDQPLVLVPRAPGAPAPTTRSDDRSRPLRALQPSEAYATVIERDTLPGYVDFLATYPRDPLAARIRVVVAARREALTWDRTVRANRPSAYWTYMQRYPRGPHVHDARRRLFALSAPLEPPPRFDVYDYDDLPPPPPDEYRYVNRPYVVFDDGDYPPPPPLPTGFLPPDRDIRRDPPPPTSGPGFLPIPVPVPLVGGHGEFGGPPGSIQQPNFGQQGPGAAPAAPAQPVAPNAVPAAPVAPTQTPPAPAPPGGPIERRRETPGAVPAVSPDAIPAAPVVPAPAGAPPAPTGREREPAVRPAVPPPPAAAPAPQGRPQPGRNGVPAAPGAHVPERNEPVRAPERRAAPGAVAPAARPAPAGRAPEPRPPGEERRPTAPSPAARAPDARKVPPVAGAHEPHAPPRSETRVAPPAAGAPEPNKLPASRPPKPNASAPRPPAPPRAKPRAAPPAPHAPVAPTARPAAARGERSGRPGEPR